MSKPWTPHEYQLRAAAFMVQNAVGALFLDMGLGKSSASLAAIKTLIRAKKIGPVLIIAPLRVCYEVWPKEVSKWEDFNDLRVEVLHGPKKDAALKRDADIYVMNPEGLEWLISGGRTDKFKNGLLIVDESTMFKHTNSKRFKLLKYLLDIFKRRFILTGTPTPNGLMDLFGQIYILDQGGTLGRYITHYRNTYFDSTGFGGYTWVPKADAAERIYEKLRPLSLRMEAKDYLTLTEPIPNRIVVEMPTKARKVYEEIENFFITRLADGEAITAPSAAAASTKMRQIANGAMYRNPEMREGLPTETEGWVELHDAKLDALQELMDSQQGKPVLLAYEFIHDADRIRTRFPEAVFIADYGAAALSKVLDRWNRGEIPLLCAHPASAGHGLNLQESCNTVVWFSITWNLDHYDQFNARVFRQGNKHKQGIIHHLVAKGTMDEAVMKALEKKSKGQKALLDALKDYITETRGATWSATAGLKA